EPCSEALRGVLDAADLRGCHDVAGDADHEQRSEPLVEQDLDGNARVRAGEHDRERLLALGVLGAHQAALERFHAAHVRREALVAGPQELERFFCGDPPVGLPKCVVHRGGDSTSPPAGARPRSLVVRCSPSSSTIKRSMAASFSARSATSYTNSIPIPGWLPASGSPARTMRATLPRSLSGSSNPGTTSAKENSVPIGSGLSVAMNVPPREMLRV